MRRNRNRSSRAANPPKIPSNAEKPASPSGISGDAEKLASSPNIPSDAEKPADPCVALAGADRRLHPRYEFIAAAEVVAAESSARIETRVRDLSQQGCYVDTNNALPLGTVTDVRITKGALLFEARARVVYSQVGKGMGLVFTAVEAEQRGTLETWLAESRETSWLAANRRRSQRVLMKIPVRVSGKTDVGLPFEEETHTLAISAHGALILVAKQLYRGTAAHSLERPDKRCLGVCCRPHRQRAPSGGSGVHAAQSYVLARGLPAKRLDAPSRRCEIPRKNARIELKSCTRC